MSCIGEGLQMINVDIASWSDKPKFCDKCKGNNILFNISNSKKLSTKSNHLQVIDHQRY